MWPSFENIKYFYDINCYTNEDIATYVELNVITQEQYKEIIEEETIDKPKNIETYPNARSVNINAE